MAAFAGAAAMDEENMPVFPIVSWEAGVLDEEHCIALWLQYQTAVVQDVEDMRWSPLFLLTAEKAKALIEELEIHLELLELDR